MHTGIGWQTMLLPFVSQERQGGPLDTDTDEHGQFLLASTKIPILCL